jgi:hypothetical protein
MLEEAEYRALVEKELSAMLRQPVIIDCYTADTGSGSRR